jgi:hypothetical protein
MKKCTNCRKRICDYLGDCTDNCNRCNKPYCRRCIDVHEPSCKKKKKRKRKHSDTKSDEEKPKKKRRKLIEDKEAINEIEKCLLKLLSEKYDTWKYEINNFCSYAKYYTKNKEIKKLIRAVTAAYKIKELRQDPNEKLHKSFGFMVLHCNP